MTQLGSLDVAASYIKKLKERVDDLQHKKASAQAMATLLGVSGISTPTITATTSSGARSPDGEKKLEAGFGGSDNQLSHPDLDRRLIQSRWSSRERE